MPNPRLEQIVLSRRRRLYERAEKEVREALRLLGLSRGDIEDLLARLQETEARYGDYGHLQLLRQADNEAEATGRLWLALSAALAGLYAGTMDVGWAIGTEVAEEIAAHVGEALAAPAFAPTTLLDALKNQTIPFADNATQLVESRIRGELIRGIYAGENVSQISQRMMGAGLKTEGTVWKTAAARAEATIRSETSRAYHAAMRANLDSQDWIVGYQWMCFFREEWPCWRCRPLHGRFFTKEELISGGEYTVSHPPLHTNCSCTLLPVTRAYGQHTIE